MSINIVTHWQTFHIDEIFAIAFLKLYVDKDINVTRTRDKSILSKSVQDPDTWVLDVGGEYNPDMKNFDHHQASFSGKWSDGTPYSTCGIVWKYLKENNLLAQHMNKETIQRIEEEVIIKVDKQDNGIEFWKEAAFIGMFNRQTDDQSKQNSQFFKALKSTEEFFKNMFALIRQNIKAEKQVLKVVKKSEEYKNVIFMDSNNKNVFKQLVFHTDKQIAVLPYKSKTSWKIQSLPSKNNAYDVKCPMPKHWGGLSDKKLQEVSGINGMVFCHKTGFMCVFEGSKEEAIEIANQIYLYNLAQK
tara:strand:- start:13842 stop:14744 length:903 start_codon:yes stop_codon:yes gene_type:complete